MGDLRSRLSLSQPPNSVNTFCLSTKNWNFMCLYPWTQMLPWHLQFTARVKIPILFTSRVVYLKKNARRSKNEILNAATGRRLLICVSKEVIPSCDLDTCRILDKIVI